MLKDIAIPAHSILAPGYPEYSDKVAAQAVFDPAKAKELMAKAGYPDGKGFPEIEIWFREGGYNGAILPPMAQYLQAQFKDILGITMNIKVMPGKDWMEGMLARKNNIYLAPYEYDYHLDPSNFYGLFYNGGPSHLPRGGIRQARRRGRQGSGVGGPREALRAGRAGHDRSGPHRAAGSSGDHRCGRRGHLRSWRRNSRGFTPLGHIGNFLYSHISVK